MLKSKLLWALATAIVFFHLASILSRALGLSFWQAGNDETAKVFAFQHSSVIPDVVVLGSSRVKAGVSAVLMEDETRARTGTPLQAFNLGQSSGDVRICHALLRDVLKGKKQPKLLLLGADTWGFNSNHLSTDVYFKYYAMQKDILFSLDRSIFPGGIEPRARGFIRDTSNLLWLAKENPFREEHRKELNLVAINRGDERLPATVNLLNMSDPVRAGWREHWLPYYKNVLLVDYETSGTADRTFRRIIRLCGEREIRLIVFNMPVHPDFMRVYEDNEYSDFITYISGVCNRERIGFFNLQDMIDTLQASDFRDPVHLNRKGADIATRYIVDTVLLPELEDMQT